MGLAPVVGLLGLLSVILIPVIMPSDREGRTLGEEYGGQDDHSSTLFYLFWIARFHVFSD